MTVDLSPIVQALIGLAAAIISAGGIYLLALVKAHITNVAVRAEVDAALTAGQGIAYSALVAGTSGGKVDFHAAEQAAVQSGVVAFNSIVSDAAMQLVKPENVRTLIRGALGNAMTVDPTISASGASSVTATVPNGGTAIAEAAPAAAAPVA